MTYHENENRLGNIVEDTAPVAFGAPPIVQALDTSAGEEIGAACRIQDVSKPITITGSKHLGSDKLAGSPTLPPYWPAPNCDRATGIDQIHLRIGEFFADAERRVRAKCHAEALVTKVMRRRESISGPLVSEDVGFADDQDSAKDFETGLRKAALNRAKRRFQIKSIGKAPRLQVRAPAGSGKTRAVAEALRAHPWLIANSVVWLVVPSIDLGKQCQDDLAKLGVNSALIRGRSAPHPVDPARRMCARHLTAEKVGAAGISIQRTLCGDEEGPRCPFFAACKHDGYQSQRQGGNGVYILAHNYLGLTSGPAPRPDVVVVDETHWNVLVKTGTAFHPQQLRGYHPKFDWREWGATRTQRYHDITCRVADALTASPDVGILRVLREKGVTRDDLVECAGILGALERDADIGITPTMDDTMIDQHLALLGRGEFVAQRQFFRALAAEIDIPRPQANAVVYEPRADVTVDGRREVQERVYVHRLQRPKIAADVPVLLIDGSADLALNRRVWGDRLIDADVTIERHCTVTQISRKVFSRASLTGFLRQHETPTVSNERKQKAAQQRTEVVDFAASVARRYGETLLVTYKKIEEDLKTELAKRHPNTCDHVRLAHFGALRGKNAWSECRAAIILGRQQPPPIAIEAISRALWSMDAEPFAACSEYVEQSRRVRLRDHAVHFETVTVHPDPRCQRVLEQIRERETEQALDRLRLIYNGEPKAVYLLSNVVCDVTVDQVISWPDLRSGGTRLERAFAAAKGVLPLSPSELARCFPRLWSSSKAAERDLERGRENTPADQIKKLFGNRGYFSVRYRRPGQRGKGTPAVIAIEYAWNPHAALECVVGPIVTLSFDQLNGHTSAQVESAVTRLTYALDEQLH